MSKTLDVKKMSVTAMLCGIAYICMFVFRFKVSFLTFDFKDAILAIISFLYGPVYGAVSSVVVAALELVSVSETGFYGFIMNVLSSAVFAGVCGAVYKFRRTLMGAVLGSLAAVVSMTAVMLAANIVITPLYTGLTSADVVGMISRLLLPFNLAKGVVNAAITMIIYKPTVQGLRRAGLATGEYRQVDWRRIIPVIAVAAVILAVAVIFVLYMLGGQFLLPGQQ